MEYLLLDIADLIFQSSYWILCLTVKNHVVEKTGQGFLLNFREIFQNIEKKEILADYFLDFPKNVPKNLPKFCFEDLF